MDIKQESFQFNSLQKNGPMKNRSDWVYHSMFYPLTDTQVLVRVIEKINEVKTHLKPMVLLDLDSTLFEVGHRTLHLLSEWLSLEDVNRFPRVKQAFSSLELKDIGYSLKDVFRNKGLDLADTEVDLAWKLAKSYWGKRFFSNDYLHLDRPYLGAVDFVNKIHQTGAQIVYLTGREHSAMYDGTFASLKKEGFPVEGDQIHFQLKKGSEVADDQHKINAALRLKKDYHIVASFENEPKNLVGLYDVLPETMHIFVETLCSDHSARVCQGIYRIKQF